jgi:ABC-type uncharacterized transport system involved in gliding motility auxiliary subunit
MINRKWNRFALIGLYISILAALISIGLYIVQRQWNLALQISIGIFIVGLAVFVLLDPQRVRKVLTGRQARHGSNALILLFAFLGILVVINYLIYDHSKRWDLTEDKTNTLAQETLDVLDRLPGIVYAQAFFSSRVSSDRADELLNQYSFFAGNNFIYEFIDPEQDPLAAQNANITRDGTIVLTMNGAQEQVETISEQLLTSALIRLMNPESKTIYFLTGHGEYNPEDEGNESYAFLKNRLEAKNYIVKLLNLLVTNSIPEDANLIVIAGPTKPVSNEEVELLSEYLESGNAMLILEDPLPFTEFGEVQDPLANYLSDSWGITLGNDVVVDFSSNQPLIAVANQYGIHTITQKMSNLASIFPTARSLVASEVISEGVSQANLILTSSQSWAETDFASLESGNIDPDGEDDVLGPISIAMVAENFESSARIVVFGDSDFASDAYIHAYGNLDMIVNSIDWAIGEEDLINLTPKEQTQRVLLTPQESTINLIFLVSIVILPGIVVLSGISAWITRRKRG